MSLGSDIVTALAALSEADKRDIDKIWEAIGDEISETGILVWNSTITYSTNDFVAYGDTIYVSLQNSNLNKQPDTETSWWVKYKAVGVSLADAGSRYTAIEVETALQEIAGSGRTTQTVKKNADDIAAIKTIKSTSSNYTVLDTDGYAVILVTVGSVADVTITLPTLSANQARPLLIIKVDSGTKEVIIDGESAETIEGFTTVRLINQYDFIHIVSAPLTWLRRAGSIAPNTGEPSLGTGHWRGDSAGTATLLDQSPTVANTWYTVTFSNAPEGAKAAWGFLMVHSSTANIKVAYIRKYGDTVAVGYQLAQMWGENIYQLGILGRFPLDGSKRAQVATNGAYRIRVYEVVIDDI